MDLAIGDLDFIVLVIMTLSVCYLILRDDSEKEAYYSRYFSYQKWIEKWKNEKDSSEIKGARHPVGLFQFRKSLNPVSDAWHPDIDRYRKLLKEKQKEAQKKLEK